MGVSDDDLQTLEKFESEFGITFPLVADEKKVVRKLYGWGRRTFLIDKEGIIRLKDKGFRRISNFYRNWKSSGNAGGVLETFLSAKQVGKKNILTLQFLNRRCIFTGKSK